jgi:hypothetical protein
VGVRGCTRTSAITRATEASPTTSREARIAHHSASPGCATIAATSGIHSAEGSRIARWIQVKRR